ncbi:hypothetical protein AB1Y20_021231 [Prymnesium parvum]|uniref:Glycoside hydrolase family 5 domain-containing protein n=1 Tax=Prymnesium parvum TaxID=97485 RepID=A0AB34JLG8_PRYPA
MPSAALLPSPARRLLVEGQHLLHEDRTPAFLRGFNLLFMLDSIFEEPREDTDELMLQLLPRTNLVRVVMIHWKDKPTDIEGADNKNDCSETWGQQWAIQESCLQQIEKVLRWTASQNLWAVLTVRASLAAGEPVAGRDLHTVFDDHELRSRFLQMWTTVAKRCRGLDMIAGYEIMSEPRVQNTAPEVVRDFYRAGCAAAHSGDPRTPCIVGAAPFYNVRGLEGALMADVPNAIYAFNFFIPRKYVNGDAVLKYKYPGPMRCCDAHEKEHARCCPGKEDQDMAQLPCCAAQVQVDKRLLEQELAVALDFRERHQVPVFMDQWAISRTSGRDRLLYVKDVLALLQAHRVHWAYWQWRQRDYSQMAVVTMNEDWDDPWFDEALVDVFRTVLGPDAHGLASTDRFYTDRAALATTPVYDVASTG